MLSKKIIKHRIEQNKIKIINFGVEHIGVFGSYAREEQKEDSDIDIFISFKDGYETYNNFMNVCYLLEEIFKGEKVEVITKNGLSPYIGQSILKEVEYV